MASARDLLDEECTSGWALACRRRNSLRSARMSMWNGPEGGGPRGRVRGKRS